MKYGFLPIVILIKLFAIIPKKVDLDDTKQADEVTAPVDEKMLNIDKT